MRGVGLGLDDRLARLGRVFLARQRDVGQRELGDAELDPDGEAVLVVVLDLGLGERCLFDGRPHDGFRALVERAVHQEFHEFLGDHAFGVEVHRQVGIGPVARDAQALELVALDVDPAFGEAAAFLAEIDDGDVVLVLALRAVLLLDLPLDGQAVAVPAGDVAGVEAHHLVRADDHVLDRLVQRVPDVEVAVRVRRAVMQDERGAVRFFAQAVVDADLLPMLQPARLAVGQPRAHREIGLGQVQGVFVVGRVGTHRTCPREVFGRFAKGWRRVSTPETRRLIVSERRARNSNDVRGMAHHGRAYRTGGGAGQGDIAGQIVLNMVPTA